MVKLKQRRYFDNDGNIIVDIEVSHGGKTSTPHINMYGLIMKGVNITMNRLNEMRSYLAMNDEIEFSYKGVRMFYNS